MEELGGEQPADVLFVLVYFRPREPLRGRAQALRCRSDVVPRRPEEAQDFPTSALPLRPIAERSGRPNSSGNAGNSSSSSSNFARSGEST